jgi:uracil phosphoribosyltransferase
MLVYVPPHPLIKHWLAVARSNTSPTPVFRSALAELGRILVYEATRDWLPTVDTQVQSPVGPADATLIDALRPVKVVPILRAGLVLVEQLNTILPGQETYHVGYVRDEETLEASAYLNKLPQKFDSEDRILIADPMLATGGTAVKVIDDVLSRGASASNITFVSVVCAPPALKLLSEKYSGMRVYTAMIDTELNDKGYIVPGLGDAGDRAYGT